MFNSLQPHRLYSPWNSPGQNTGVGSHFLLQGIFPTQGSNPGLPHCRHILFQLSHQGSPRILEWVAYPFSSGSSKPRNWTGVSCIAAGSFTNCAIRESAFKAGLADTGLSLQGQLHFPLKQVYSLWTVSYNIWPIVGTQISVINTTISTTKRCKGLIFLKGVWVI